MYLMYLFQSKTENLLAKKNLGHDGQTKMTRKRVENAKWRQYWG